jgi:pimeloyl-ACP methyl ester carboxylesterase
MTEKFPAEERSFLVLKDSAATRSGIIAGFREHLAQAGPNDIAFFQFAGHGARWKSSSAFNAFYPDGFDEGLVCWDSRREPDKPGSYDLADKELAVLVAELAKKCPHVVVLLDCCHSGSGTRSADDLSQMAIRMSHQVDTERPLETYLDGHYSQLLEQNLRLETPASRHILLAACERKKQAFEGYDRRGIFSSTLLEQLDKCQGRTTYADLFLRVRATVQKKAYYQTPQFEVFRGFDGHQGFLGFDADRNGRKIFAVNQDPLTHQWTVDFGAIHGFVPVQDQPLEFSILDQSEDRSGKGETDNEASVGTAVAASVGLTRSVIHPTVELPSDRPLFAKVTSLPASPMLVSISGDPGAIELLKSELQLAEISTIEFVEAIGRCREYGVEAVTDSTHGPVYLIQHYSAGRLVQGVKGLSDVSARHVIRALAQIAEWESRLALQNHHSQVAPETIPFHFIQRQGSQSIRHEGSQIRLTIGDESVHGQLVTENKTGQSLYSLLIYFSDDYGMTILDTDEFPSSANERTLLLDGSPDVEFFLDVDGPSTSIERFMLVVSNHPIDEFLLGTAENIDPGAANVVLQPLETGFVDPLKGRKIRTGQKKIAEVEWFTRMIEIQLVRPEERFGETTVEMNHSLIKLLPHPQFTAEVTLQPATSGRSASGGSDFWQALTNDDLSLVSFSNTRGQNLSVVELSNIRNSESLADVPVEMELAVPLLDNESLVALTFDGQHILLAGECQKMASGATRFSMSELPTNNRGARGIVSTLKLYFFKTCFKANTVSSLRAVEYKASGSITLERHSLQQRVAAADRIVLMIHGLLGDGASMATALNPVSSTLLEPNAENENRNTLYLVWDYEQLCTTLQTSANELHDQLAKIGIGPDDGKELVIVAHSIGGLMARWLIEQGEGRNYVEHLILLGVPNDGAPLGKIGLAASAARLLLTVAVNIIPGVAGVAGYILSVLINLNRVTVAIEQLDADGDFLRQLNASEDPKVRYTIISGDVYEMQKSDNRIHDLLMKLGQGRIGQLLFENAAHDTVVSVGSSRNVSSNRTPPPQFRNLPCHHFGYLDDH